MSGAWKWKYGVLPATQPRGKPMSLISQQPSFFLPAPLTAQQGNQLSGFNVEFPFGDDLPLVKAALAEGFSLGEFAQRPALEFNDLSH